MPADPSLDSELNGLGLTLPICPAISRGTHIINFRNGGRGPPFPGTELQAGSSQQGRQSCRPLHGPSPPQAAEPTSAAQVWWEAEGRPDHCPCPALPAVLRGRPCHALVLYASPPPRPGRLGLTTPGWLPPQVGTLCTDSPVHQLLTWQTVLRVPVQNDLHTAICPLRGRLSRPAHS